MSTRANIKFTDGVEELWFYRHSDGYPEGAMPTLEKMVDAYKEGKIRSDIEQSAGWLIVLGYLEYLNSDPLNRFDFSRWKVGAYEPATGRHGDIEYLYIFDLKESELRVYETPFDEKAPDKLINTISFRTEK